MKLKLAGGVVCCSDFVKLNKEIYVVSMRWRKRKGFDADSTKSTFLIQLDARTEYEPDSTICTFLIQRN